MLNQTSTTAIARILLLAGILLAFAFLASRSFFPAFAQENPDEVTFEENSEDSVGVYTATDPEGEDIVWSLLDANVNEGAVAVAVDDYPDHGDFSIDGGVLTFKDGPPDFEGPKGGLGNDSNTYSVMVVAKAGDGDSATMTYQPVVVTVKNVEEDGVIDIPVIQPKEDVDITVTLSDPDGEVVENDVKWQWATSTSATGPWTDIEPTEAAEDNAHDGDDATYKPRLSDRGSFLRVTATYTDGYGEDDPFTDGVDESIETASAVTDNPVLVADYTNTAPIFPDQDPDAVGSQTDQEREISEDAEDGDSVGDPVVASDIGADGSQETLFYSLEDGNPAGEDDTTFFAIDSGTGQISVDDDAMLDFDDGQQSFSVIVRATDPGNMNTPVNVTIKVTNVDEDPVMDEPTQIAGLTIKKVEESVSSPDTSTFARLISTYEAEDQEDEDGTLTWSLSGADSSKFVLSSMTGASVDLSLNRDVDYENTGDSRNNKDFNVRLTVRDSGNNTDTRDVTVEITNVEERGTITIFNRQPEVGTSLRATASDPDNFVGSVTYRWATSANNISGGTWNLISGATSQNYTPRASDASSESTSDRFYLRVTATYRDALGTDEVTIEDISEQLVKPRDTDGNQSPVFTGGNPTDKVDEDDDELLDSDFLVTDATLEVTDDTDGGLGQDLLTYTLGGSDRAHFRINPVTNGVDIHLLRGTPIDHEKKSKYNATVTATDPSNRSTTATVTVNVDDDDEAPVFSQAPAPGVPVEFPENSDQAVTTLKASDPEGSNIQWTVDLNSADTFSIDGGVLRFKSTPDYETIARTFTVTVTASDGSETSDVQVTVNVENVEEDGEVSLSRPQPKVRVDVTATLIDDDEVSGNVQWQWATSTSPTGPWYDIAVDTGVTENSRNETYKPRVNDVGYYLRATATYSDGSVTTDDLDTEVDETDDKASMVSDNRVLRADYMNEAPKWPVVNPDGADTDAMIAQTRKLREDAKAGDPVGDPVVASDEGADGTQETLRYSIDDDNATEELFVLDSLSGQISVGDDASLNYEADANRSYLVTVTATDPGNMSSAVGVTINLLNANESPEVGDEIDTNNQNLTTKSVDETGANANPYIALYDATDHEDDAASPVLALAWSLSGPDSEKFGFYTANNCETAATDLTGDSIRVCFKAQPDFEARADSDRDNVYNVTVDVTDSDDNTTSQDVAVTVKNVVEEGTVALSARQPEVSTPISASLTDPDDGIRDITWQWSTAPEGTTTWTSIAGAASRSYTPVSGDVGKDLAARATYRDAQAENDQFTAIDESLVMATGTASFAVIGTVANNQPPVFPDQDDNTSGDQSDRTTRYVHENTKPGNDDNPVDQGADLNPLGNVGAAIEAMDSNPEHADEKLTYTLGGSDAGLFTIASSTGQIAVGEGTDLDFETKNSFTVTVTATDSSGSSDTIIVTIMLRDVDEAPELSKRGLAVSGSRSVSYAENDTADVATYTATGSDSAGATWSLEGPDASAFAISSGVLAFRSSPNFESPSDQGADNMYEVTVKATSGTLTATRNVSVSVTNEDEDGTVNLRSPGNEVKVGVELTAELDERDEETNVTWQWASSSSNTGPWDDITGETNNTYTPVEGNVGNYLRVTASYTDATFGSDSEEAITGDAVEAASTAGTPGSLALSPTTQLTSGDRVTATLTDADNPVASSYVWRWERSADGSTNWSSISGATSASYTTTAADAGNYLRATVTYDDDSGTGLTAGPVATADRVKLHTYDANASGRIERSEVIEAIRDYLFNRTITRDQVIQVIRLYLSPPRN